MIASILCKLFYMIIVKCLRTCYNVYTLKRSAMGFGKNLINLRNNANPKLSQDEVARVLGMTRPTYKQLETEERIPSNAELQAISELFGIRTETLLDPNANIVVNEAPVGGAEFIEIDEAKYRNLILYLAERVGAWPNVGETVFYKLIYFTETLALSKLGRAIAGEQFYKRQYGPVPVSFLATTRNMIASNELDLVVGRYYTYMQRKYLPRVNSSGLTEEEKTIIDRVIRLLGNKTATELSDLSHQDMPWIKGTEGKIIDLSLIKNTPADWSMLMGRSSIA